MGNAQNTIAELKAALVQLDSVKVATQTGVEFSIDLISLLDGAQFEGPDRADTLLSAYRSAGRLGSCRPLINALRTEVEAAIEQLEAIP